MNTPFTRAPHQGAPGPLAPSAPNAALLIDFDNVTMGMRSDLSKDLKKLLQSEIIKGKVTVQRAYADWRRYPQYIVPLSENSIDLIFAPAYGSSKKNATDIRMAIDGMELVFTRPEIGTFILLTGDSDFSSLVLKLKEYGKYVIGVGIQESSSDILVQNCDEYYSYTNLAGLRKTSDSERSAVDPWVLVERAINQMAEKDDVMRSDRLKQVMIEIDPGFDEGDFGYSKFSRFLTEASSKGLVQLRKLENGQYEVGPGTRGKARREESPRKDEQGRQEHPRREEQSRREEQPREGRGRGQGREREREDRFRSQGRREEATPPIQAEEAPSPAPQRERALRREDGEGPLQGAYALLRRALEALKEQGRESIRDSDVKRKMLELDGSFDENELGFGKFSRFLRQAHDHEVVDLQKREGGNYEVSLGTPKVGEAGARSLPPESPSEAPEDDERIRDLGSSVQALPAIPLETMAPVVSSPTPPSPGGAASRGLGPRRGSTRRRREEEGPPPFLEGQAAGGLSAKSSPRAAGQTSQVDPSLLGLPTDPEAQIRYLTNSYRGVGRKTAEALVEGFGGDLFAVLQNQPERVEQVVPAARAEQVLEAWKADYERRAREDAGDLSASGRTEGNAEEGEGERHRGGGRRRTRRGPRRGGAGSGGGSAR